MKIWSRVREKWPDWLSVPSRTKKTDQPTADTPKRSHLNLAKDSLRDLLNNKFVPDSIRNALKDDYQQVQSMLDKLEHGHIHIAIFGRVSVGKSALVNALLGEQKFKVSPLHGETKNAQYAQWKEIESNGIFFIDTPGINEVAGEGREKLAHEVAEQSDLVLFIIDADITDIEFNALKILSVANRPILIVFNKADRYSKKDRELLINRITEHATTIVPQHHIVCASANPNDRLIIQLDEHGNETETWQQREPDVWELKNLLWEILETEGKTLTALNATLFAGQLNDSINQRIIEVKKELADKTIRFYCIAKGLAVAVNPIPITDLIAATALDAALVYHMSRVYGLQISKAEAGNLVKTIAGQMILLMGTIWGVHLVSSALKGGSLGLSTLVTASIQGAVAYYGTLIIGKASQRYFAKGGSWGDGGPKQVVQEILQSLDRSSIIDHARKDIYKRLKS